MVSTLATQSTTKYTFEARMWLTHPSYSTTQGNDIALVYCPTNVIKSKNVGIAYLYMQDPTESSIFDAFYLNQAVQVAGWGDALNNGLLSDTLKYTEQQIVAYATCQSIYPTITFGPDKLCIVQPTTTIQVSNFYSKI
jgi:hypothetical protein